jgi:4'-phosphopantetheinyl transferase
MLPFSEVSLEQIQAWHFRLDDDSFARSISEISAAGLLSADEIARAARFHFEKDRLRFTRCRGVLRLVLARFLEIPPERIQFFYTAKGKPELSAGQNPKGLNFNVSHSDNMAVIAVGVGPALGVDIEKMRSNVNTNDLAERFFSTRERQALQSLPDAARFQAFYACWTRKEAFLKANGEGLSFPLSDFSVTVDPGAPPRIEEIGDNSDAGLTWSLIDLNLASGFRSALAVERPDAEATAFALDASTIRGLQ